MYVAPCPVFNPASATWDRSVNPGCGKTWEASFKHSIHSVRQPLTLAKLRPYQAPLLQKRTERSFANKTPRRETEIQNTQRRHVAMERLQVSQLITPTIWDARLWSHSSLSKCQRDCYRDLLIRRFTIPSTFPSATAQTLPIKKIQEVKF